MLRATCLMLLVWGGAAAQQEPALERRFDGVTTKHIAIHARVGRIAVMPSDTGEVHVSVALISRDASRLAGCRASAQLESEARDQGVRLVLEQRRRERCSEDWTVRVPAATALSLRTGVGDITVDPGAAAVPRTIDAVAEVGDVVVVAAAGHGHLKAQARVGRVRLDFLGARVTPSRSGAGEQVELQGQGSRHLRLTSGVGNVQLTVKE